MAYFTYCTEINTSFVDSKKFIPDPDPTVQFITSLGKSGAFFYKCL
jgi:hypothetical protein